MAFDRKKFFDGVKDRIDPTLEQSQVDGLEFLLGWFEGNAIWADVRHTAYALATIFHETAGSFQPVEEGYYLGSKAVAFQKKLRYYPYFGRGYVQLTWKKNYDRAGKSLGLNFIDHPELVLNPENSFWILSRGMRYGWFTGKKLSDYIHGDHCDYVGARKIINGADKAGIIAGYAKSFEKILTNSEPVPASGNLSSLTESADSGSSPPPLTGDSNSAAKAPTVNQSADQIINTGDNTPPAPAPQDISVTAPQPMGSVQTSAKVVIAGIVVPPFLVSIIHGISNAIDRGFIKADDIGNAALSLVQNNMKYILIASGLVVVVIIVKKIERGLIFLFVLMTHAIPSWNNVSVVAPVPVEKPVRWWQFWK